MMPQLTFHLAAVVLLVLGVQSFDVAQQWPIILLISVASAAVELIPIRESFGCLDAVTVTVAIAMAAANAAASVAFE